VAAIDFGLLNRRPENQPRSFRELVAFLQEQRTPDCWVSTTCYDPERMVRGWVLPRLAASRNLVLLDRTVVRGASRRADGTLSALNMVQRRPRAGAEEWVPLSQTLEDWYSPAASVRFDKRWLNVTADVFIEATEFGDVMMTANLTVGQGVERPAEDSPPGSDSTCGQAATLPFFMELLEREPPAPDPAPSGSTAGGAPFSAAGCCCPSAAAAAPAAPGNATASFAVDSGGGGGGVGVGVGAHARDSSGGIHGGSCDYRTIWSYRRAFSTRPHGAAPHTAVAPGDISQQNWGNPSGNDLDK
jgi:hypothetical protein